MVLNFWELNVWFGFEVHYYDEQFQTLFLFSVMGNHCLILKYTLFSFEIEKVFHANIVLYSYDFYVGKTYWDLSLISSQRSLDYSHA